MLGDQEVVRRVGLSSPCSALFVSRIAPEPRARAEKKMAGGWKRPHGRLLNPEPLFPAVASCRLQLSDGGSFMGGSLQRLLVHPLAERFGLVCASNQ